MYFNNVGADTKKTRASRSIPRQLNFLDSLPSPFLTKSGGKYTRY